MINGFKDMDIDPAAARTFVNQVRCDTLTPAPPGLAYTIQTHHTRFLLMPTSWTPMAMDRSLSWNSCASCITTVSEPSAVWTQAHTTHRGCAQTVNLALTPTTPCQASAAVEHECGSLSTTSRLALPRRFSRFWWASCSSFLLLWRLPPSPPLPPTSSTSQPHGPRFPSMTCALSPVPRVPLATPSGLAIPTLQV